MEAKQRKVRMTDEDWDGHCALAQAAGMSANELLVRYVRRANDVAAGRPIVEEEDVPAEHASTLPRLSARASRGRLPTKVVGYDALTGEAIEARGPLPKGGKK